MTHRRGLHRLYMVLTVDWIGTILYAVVAREWRPEAMFNGGWESVGLRVDLMFLGGPAGAAVLLASK